MTTDKIRAAAQKLHDIVMKQCSGYTSGPGFEAAELARAMHAALAEPAQAAPASGAVPVVAYIEHHKAGDNLLWDHPGGKCSSLVRQSDHLAAMEALRAKLDDAERECENRREQNHAAAIRLTAHMQATEALLQEVERLKELSVQKILLAVVPGEDGMGEEVYAQSVTEVENLLTDLGEKSEGLQLETTRLKANRSAQAARVIQLVDDYMTARSMAVRALDLYSSGVLAGGYDEVEKSSDDSAKACTDLHAAVSKLAGGS